MKPVSYSIQRRLIITLLATLLGAWSIALLLVHRAAETEVRDVFDADLARSARTLQALLQHEADEHREISGWAREASMELSRSDLREIPHLASIMGKLNDQRNQPVGFSLIEQHESRVKDSELLVVARFADGRLMLRDAAVPAPPMTTPGFSDLEINGQSWRIYRLTEPGSGFTVQVGERQAFRERLVASITRNTLMPALLMLPVLALLVWLIVGRAFAPLQRVTRSVSQHAAETVETLSEHGVPREIQPLVGALNLLFQRVHSAIERERRFTADAAHELRTPLAGISAQLQIAREAVTEAPSANAINQALRGSEQAAHTVEQLLMLARADAMQSAMVLKGKVDLRELAMEIVGFCSQAAVEKAIDLGIEAPTPVTIFGEPTLLGALLRNLVDNALRYTPRGGQVTVRLAYSPHRTGLTVADDGPGISEQTRSLIFDRFYRGESEQAARVSGCGLGLSIVQRIAEVHQARVETGPGIGGAGLSITVWFAETPSSPRTSIS